MRYFAIGQSRVPGMRQKFRCPASGRAAAEGVLVSVESSGKPRLPRVVAFSGSAKRPSRTRILVEALGAELGRLRGIDLAVYDLVDAGPGLGATQRDDLPPPAARLIEAIEGADALIVGTPVYQGGYAGLFKHVFDFVDPVRMAGMPVALTATGGGLRHALVVEHGLRPLFGFFAAHVAPTSVYAGSDDMVDGRILDETVVARLAAAAAELAALLDVARPLDAGAAA
jgi:FMN reductase